MIVTVKNCIKSLLCLSLIGYSGSPLLAADDGASLYIDKACIACHGARGGEPVMSAYPVISGQNEVYLLAQMTDIKSGTRNNSHSVAMSNIMDKVSAEEMAILAKWLAEQ